MKLNFWFSIIILVILTSCSVSNDEDIKSKIALERSIYYRFSDGLICKQSKEEFLIEICSSNSFYGSYLRCYELLFNQDEILQHLYYPEKTSFEQIPESKTKALYPQVLKFYAYFTLKTLPNLDRLGILKKVEFSKKDTLDLFLLYSIGSMYPSHFDAMQQHIVTDSTQLSFDFEKKIPLRKILHIN